MIAGRLFDPTKDDGCVPVERRAGLVLDQFGKGLPEACRKVLRGACPGPVFVDDPPARRFERGRQCCCSFGNILVSETLKILGDMTRNQASEKEEQSRLRFGQALQHREDHSQVLLLLSQHDCRRVRLGGGQVSACARAPDFHEPFRPAAYGANLVAQGRAVASGLSTVTEWTDHGTQASHGRRAAINAQARSARIAWGFVPVLYLQIFIVTAGASRPCELRYGRVTRSE